MGGGRQNQRKITRRADFFWKLLMKQVVIAVLKISEIVCFTMGNAGTKAKRQNFVGQFLPTMF